MSNAQLITAIRVSFFWIWLFGASYIIDKPLLWQIVWFFGILGIQMTVEAFTEGAIAAWKDWKRTGRRVKK